MVAHTSPQESRSQGKKLWVQDQLGLYNPNNNFLIVKDIRKGGKRMGTRHWRYIESVKTELI